MKKRIVHLVLKYHWYDMIVAGKKHVEHRSITERWLSMLVARPVDAIVFHRGYTSTTVQKDVVHVDLGPDTDPGPHLGKGKYIRLWLQ